MPTYNVTDPVSGKEAILTGDSEPTEAELNQIFSTNNSQSQQQVGSSQPDWAHNSLLRPGLRQKHPLWSRSALPQSLVAQNEQGVSLCHR